MSNDPFAGPAAYRAFQDFLNQLAAEFRAGRGPLETALADLLLAWDISPGPRALADPLLAAGAALRDAGLADEVRRMCEFRMTKNSPDGMPVAIALLNGATVANEKTVADLLATLHDEYPDLLPSVRATLEFTALDTLRCWCDRHTRGYRDRLRDEVKRLAVDMGELKFASKWNPPPDPVAAKLLVLLFDDDTEFILDWLNPPTNANDADDLDDCVSDTTTNTDTTTDAPTVVKKVKGKNIDARMLKALAENRETFGWTASQWAQHLRCAESTVKETKTWKEHLKAVRASSAVEHARKMDRARLVSDRRPNRAKDDEEFDD